MLTRFYQSPLLDWQSIAQGLETPSITDGLKVQNVGDADHPITCQTGGHLRLAGER